MACFCARWKERNNMSNRIIIVSLTLWFAVTTAEVAGLANSLESTPPYAFNPTRLEGLVENSEQQVQVSCNRSLKQFDSLSLKVVSADPHIATVSSDKVISCQCGPVFMSNMSQFVIRGLFLGRTVVNVETLNATNLLKSVNGLQFTVVNASLPVVDYHVSVVREQRFIDRLFIGVLSITVICANIGMGCTIDLAVVKEVLTKPIAPAIGFCCQYLIMPLTAFATVKAFGLTGGLALGYFATGCAPGGGVSNLLTYLLGGDVSLSVTMTLVSIIASLGMFPLWLFTLGPHLIGDDVSITIPFGNIMIILSAFLIPLIIGLLVQRYCKRLLAIISRLLRPLLVISMLIVWTVGIWSNLFVFWLIRPLLLLAACLLPYVGFLLSGAVAFILRQPPPRILTIAMETGIQNSALPIVLMRLSLSQPDADLSIVGPVTVAMCAILPLWVAFVVTELRRRCRRRQSRQQVETAGNGAEPVPLKAVSDSSGSGKEMISASSNAASK